MKKYIRTTTGIIESEDYAPCLFVLAHKEELLYVCEDVFGWANISQGSADRFSYKSIDSSNLIEDLKWNGIDLEDVCIILPDGNTMDFLTKDMEVLKQFKDSDYVREADTIEQLVDEYVLVLNGKPKVIHNYDDAKLEMKEHLKYIKSGGKETFVIYGSIWVNRGVWDKPTLEPVVKMNEEGELKLKWK